MSNVHIDPNYNGHDFFHHNMMPARYIVARKREWFARETRNAHFHPFVHKAVLMHRPDKWQDLLLQWPHEAETYKGDFTRVAYTRDERSGEADRQIVTTLGKYLRQHFSFLPDHAIRDLVALATPKAATCKFVHTTVEMIHHLQRGPSSCMVWSRGDEDNEDEWIKDGTGLPHHPYEAYAPEYGWHMAVRMEGSDTVGRALCHTNKNGRNTFVRSYKKSSGYSPADEMLEAWLKEQGYRKAGSWDYAMLKYIPVRRRGDATFIAPYIDGGAQHVNLSHHEGKTVLVICDEGDYICNNTDGTADEAEYESCNDCGARIDDGDGYWVGAYEDDHVCTSCVENDYYYAISRGGAHRYIRQSYCVWVESQDEHYDEDYLDYNDIVQIKDGEYEHKDNAVECEDDGDWYYTEDYRLVEVDGSYYLRDGDLVVYTEDSEEYILKEDAHHCEDDDLWYADRNNMPNAESESESE